MSGGEVTFWNLRAAQAYLFTSCRHVQRNLGALGNPYHTDTSWNDARMRAQEISRLLQITKWKRRQYTKVKSSRSICDLF